MLKRTFLFAGILISFLFCLQAQNLDEKLTLDPKIRYGKLDNGFTYYIRHNEEPKNRVEFRLAVNAGSIVEDDDQQGLAHLTEHMCFNGTKHFKKSAIVDFIESTGVKFGEHLNAYTSFDQTVYMLQMPTDRQGLIDSAFLIMQDWAHNVTMSTEEINKERGVVIEEWRLGLGANERMRNEYFPILLKGSRYAERLPIGKEKILETFDPDVLRKFYHDWYRPDLMALIVVGDVNVDKMEKQIKDHFSTIKNPTDERKRVEYDIPDNTDPLIAIATDKEATYSMVNVFYKHNREIKKTVEDFRQGLKEQLYNGMLNARLAEIAQKPSAPFMYAYAGYGGFLGRSKDAYSSFGMAKQGQIDSTLKILLDENERVEQFGFTSTEFARQKDDLLRNYEKNYNERDKTKSRNLANEYVSNFLDQEPVPGITEEYKLSKELIPTIQLDEINQLAKEWITDNNMAVLITAPDKEGVTVPTEAQVKTIIANSKSAKLTAYVDKVTDEPLISKEPEPGKITDIQKKDNGYEVWKLSNGAEVYVKPTDFKNDEILYKAYTTGGTSLLSDSDVVMAQVFDDVVNESGLGNFTGIALEKKLTGKIVDLNCFFNELRQGFNGSASPKDLETLLQLQYLYFTHPHQDKEVFEKVIDSKKNQVKFMMDNPRVAFYDSLYKAATSNSPRTIVIPTQKQLDGIKEEDIYNTYRNFFEHVDGFKFFFVGNIKTDELKPLVEKYIASLPVKNSEQNWKDVTPKFPDGITKFTVYKGQEPQSQVAIMMKGKYDYNFENNLVVKTLVKILDIKLREKIREDESGTYGIGVYPDLNKYPRQDYSFTISFGCSPDNIDKLVNSVFDELKKIQKDGPTDVDLNKAKETFIRDRETSMKENKFWLGMLDNEAFLGDNIMTEDAFDNAVKSITAGQVKEAANKYITLDHYLFASLKPEKIVSSDSEKAN